MKYRKEGEGGREETERYIHWLNIEKSLEIEGEKEKEEEREYVEGKQKYRKRSSDTKRRRGRRRINRRIFTLIEYRENIKRIRMVRRRRRNRGI